MRHHRLTPTAALLALACAALAAALAPLGARADGASGTVSGAVTGKGKGRGPERLAVYLERSTSTEPITPTASASTGGDLDPGRASPTPPAEGSSTSAGSGFSQPGRGAGGGRREGRARVSMREARFAPDLLVVAAGESVLFTNDEAQEVVHDAYSLSRENGFALGLLGRGESQAVGFSQAGRATVYCSLHPDQEMTVLVVPSRLYAVPDLDGAFEVRDVPPGRWTVRTLQASPRWREAARDVIVEAGRASRADLELAR